MNALSGQFDLFDLDPGYRETPRRIAPVRRGRQQPIIAPGTEDGLVQRLEDTGRFKVLRKLVPGQSSIAPAADSRALPS